MPGSFYCPPFSITCIKNLLPVRGYPDPSGMKPWNNMFLGTGDTTVVGDGLGLMVSEVNFEEVHILKRGVIFNNVDGVNGILTVKEVVVDIKQFSQMTPGHVWIM